MNNIEGYGLVIKFFEQNGDSYLALEDVCHVSADAALADAFLFLNEEEISTKKESRVIGIFAIDGHGNTSTYLNRSQIIDARDSAEAHQDSLNRDDRRYGSYEQQHSLRVGDVVGAA